MELTILTPTYNRAELLKNLFQSLQTQIIHKFEWLIVDDGSTDNTRVTVEEFIKIAKFPIRYRYKSGDVMSKENRELHKKVLNSFHNSEV